MTIVMNIRIPRKTQNVLAVNIKGLCYVSYT